MDIFQAEDRPVRKIEILFLRITSVWRELLAFSDTKTDGQEGRHLLNKVSCNSHLAFFQLCPIIAGHFCKIGVFK